jgi:hypothetical protein
MALISQWGNEMRERNLVFASASLDFTNIGRYTVGFDV